MFYDVNIACYQSPLSFAEIIVIFIYLFVRRKREDKKKKCPRTLIDVGYFEKEDECNVCNYEYDEHDRKESELYDGMIKCFEFYFNPTRRERI